MNAIERVEKSFAAFPGGASDGALTLAARFWFVTLLIGQSMFSAYIVSFYLRSAAHGRLGDRSTFLAHGYIAGDTAGNVAAAVHIVLAAFVNLSGAIQLVPQIRQRARRFHRLNGRIYIASALAISVSALYMVWFRGAVGDLSQHLAGTLDAVLIGLFAALALRSAIARDFGAHRRWALRLFMVVSGVWFFRVGLMLWLLINRGPVGFDPKTFVGPFLSFLTFAEFLFPLAVLELYLRARDGTAAPQKLAVATGLFALTIAMGVGVFGAIVGLWLPNM
jgi:uncharacterized membrane protein